MLSALLGRSCSTGIARAVLKTASCKTKFSTVLVGAKPKSIYGNVNSHRFFSSTPLRCQETAAAAAISTAQSTAEVKAPITEAVDENGLDDVASIYDGEYLPHNTQIYFDFLNMEQLLAEKASNVVDISSGSGVSISQIAEGLSTDILIAAGGTPSLQDMGLGSYYTPPGLLQIALDYIHSCGSPWWVTIAVATVCMKTVMLPLIIKSQRTSSHLSNNLPEMQRLQAKMTTARRSGNMLETSKAANELASFMKKKNVNMFASLYPLMIQTPVFVSFFFALRGMANLPIESMKTGGISWFTDLTIPDPTYILPLITSASVLLMFEMGADGAVRSDHLRLMKYVMRGIPIVMFPFIINFPAAILCYWSTSNLYSLVQTLILKQETIRSRLKIPKREEHKRDETIASKGFVKDMKETMANVRIGQEINNRARSDEIRFKQAGLGPIVKTFKHPQNVKQTAKN